MLDRLKRDPSNRRLAMARLMAMAFVIFAFLGFNTAHAKPTHSAHANHKNSAHAKHTRNNSNLITNSNNLIKNGSNLIYDSDLNITWCYDPNLGAVNWNDAMKWAEDLVIGDATDWQLPAASVSGSALEHLYYVELGNTGSGLTNSGPFSNLQAVNYWTNTTWPSFQDNAYVYSFIDGYQGYAEKNPNSTYIIYYSAIAIHAGNVGATQIPEPGVIFLFAPGLAGLAVVRRKFIGLFNRNS